MEGSMMEKKKYTFILRTFDENKQVKLTMKCKTVPLTKDGLRAVILAEMAKCKSKNVCYEILP